ncbi:MAG: MerR family transcriptional regulator [Lachnospiraceae bacterium]
MTIKELEILTGVTKQNIRFYETKGLLFPERNPENDYRQYGEEDVRRLRMIKMFRMLDMPLEEIRTILDGQEPLEKILGSHLEHLKSREAQLLAAIDVCQELLHKDREAIDPSQVLMKMEEMQKSGKTFRQIIHDYKLFTGYESRKMFSFVPDNMALTPREFTDALLQFAKEDQSDVVILKEGMYPVFLYNGVEYTAYREFSRFGAVIKCEMTHPDEEEPEHLKTMSKAYKNRLKLVNYLINIGCLGIVAFLAVGGRGLGPWTWLFMILLMIMTYTCWLRYYRNVKG